MRQRDVRFRSTEGGEYYVEGAKGLLKMLMLGTVLDSSESFLEGCHDDLRDLFRAGGSLGGTRPKAALRMQSGQLVIAKFSRRDDEWNTVAFERVQHVLADRAGINVAKSHLENLGGRSVLLIERFDRLGDRRIGFMSALTAPEARDMETRSYLELADVVASGSRDPEGDLEELFRRTVFQILTSNTDDHLRNHGLLRHQNGWDLSPAYDLNPNPEQIGHLQMSVDLEDTSAHIELALTTTKYYRLSLVRESGLLVKLKRLREDGER